MHASPLRRALRRYAPFWVGRTLRAAYYYPGDLRDALLGRRDPMVPGRGEAALIGGGDFAGMGRRFLEHFVTLGELSRHDHVLDVGCGVGRMALPLTGFLDHGSAYWGFDPVDQAVQSCRRRITARFPHFNFYVADVWSKSYNRRGTILARDYVFPHQRDSLDFVFATSVFTHMVTTDLENYLGNIARVLRPGGRCFATYFLLNRRTRRSDSARDFRYPVDDRGAGFSVSRVESEKAMAFDESFLLDLYARHGLVVRPLKYGRWATTGGGPAFQDIVVAQKQ